MSEVLRFIRAHENARGPMPPHRHFLTGLGKHDHVEIPAALHQVLLEMLTNQHAVTVDYDADDAAERP
ncbi:MAG: hypothetical protein WA966_08815 [Ornithinimicrobium sp.]